MTPSSDPGSTARGPTKEAMEAARKAVMSNWPADAPYPINVVEAVALALDAFAASKPVVAWQKKPPTPGWWWLRETRGSYVTPPEIVHVFLVIKSGAFTEARVFHSEGDRDVRCWHDGAGYGAGKAEWAGPIAEPLVAAVPEAGKDVVR